MKQELDVYEQFGQQFGLDMNNPLIGWLVEAVCEAGAKLYKAFKEKMIPAYAFSAFVKTWELYSLIPEDVKHECDGLVKEVMGMWRDVARSEADLFCYLCSVAPNWENGMEDLLCKISIELLDAIAVSNGQIKMVSNIFMSAMSLAESKRKTSGTCRALLYILCARIWYRCLGYSCIEEEALLSEGLRYHLMAKADNIVYMTELYSIHIAAAIQDIIVVRQENGTTAEEILSLAKEGYSMLARFDSPNADYARQCLYECSGISADSALLGEIIMSLPMDIRKKRQVN